jgi:hypothetical protein
MLCHHFLSDTVTYVWHVMAKQVEVKLSIFFFLDLVVDDHHDKMLMK